MILKSERSLESLREVLYDKIAVGTKTAYWVFSEIADIKWENLTVISPGRYGIEFIKTYGHYHSTSEETEIYKVLEGEGIFQLQKKFFEGTVWVKNKISELLFVRATAGDELAIPKNYGHSWTNIGSTPLVTLDNWKWGHKPEDYSPIKELGGMAHFVTYQHEDLKFSPNKRYDHIPEPKWLTAKEFSEIFSSL